MIAAGLAYYVTSTATGSLAIQIRDTPVAWSKVLLTFSDVGVHPSSAANGTGWVSLPIQARQVDLLALGNLSQVLALGPVAPGAYSAVRIVVSSASGILSSGAAVPISVTGSVLETTPSFLVRGGATTTVTVDLNLSQSLTQTTAGWVFAPVLGPTQIA